MSRRSTIRLDDPDTLKAVEMYRNGATLTEAAKAVYMSRGGLKYRFEVLGISTDGRRKGSGTSLSPEIIEKIRCEHQSGKSYYRIAKEMGVSAPTVRKYARGGK